MKRNTTLKLVNFKLPLEVIEMLRVISKNEFRSNMTAALEKIITDAHNAMVK